MLAADDTGSLTRAAGSGRHSNGWSAAVRCPTHSGPAYALRRIALRSCRLAAATRRSEGGMASARSLLGDSFRAHALLFERPLRPAWDEGAGRRMLLAFLLVAVG